MDRVERIKALLKTEFLPYRSRLIIEEDGECLGFQIIDNRGYVGAEFVPDRASIDFWLNGGGNVAIAHARRMAKERGFHFWK